jgi:two-component system LytT family sensor kinase
MPKRSVVVYHLFFWLIFIGYELAGVKFTVGLTGPFSMFILFYALYISLFYFNAHVILDYSFFKTKHPYMVSSLLIVLEIVWYFFAKVFIEIGLTRSNVLTFVSAIRKQYVFTNFFRIIYFIGVSIAYWSTLYMFRFREKNHRMETDRLTAVAQTLELENKLISAENAYLQNQVSPHLLFNSLNFIYNTVYKISEKAGNGVMLLAELLRYSLIRVEDNRLIPVSLELEQIENLIRLNRLRFGERLFLNFTKRGKVKEHQVLPLILITLVENMMKHGDLGEPAYPGSIRLEVMPGQLLFETKNKKKRTHLFPKSGLGLRNLEKRLANFYPGRYQLDIQEDENEFTILLNLTYEHDLLRDR